MRIRMMALLLALVLSCSGMTFPAAAAGETTTASVPITVTVINTMNQISITCPASLPVAVVDGYVVTASTAAITNTADSGTVRISSVEITASDTFAIGDYDDFLYAGQVIALSINGCATTGEGALTITRKAFPDLDPGESLTLDYDAKISITGSNLDAVTAACLVFTLETV